VLEIAEHLPHLNWPTVLLSLAVITSGLILNRLAPRIPYPTIALVLSVASSARWSFSNYGITTIGVVPAGLPRPAWPDIEWADIEPVLPIAVSCFLIILMQSATTARLYAFRRDQNLNEKADLAGVSAANAAAAFSGSFVVNASPTQTAMVERSGGSSQLAPLTAAAIVAVVLLFLSSPLQYLPQCVLGSLIFLVALHMIDLKELRAIRRESPGEFYLAVATAAIVLGVGVEEGIVSAMIMSLLRIIQHSYHPHTAVLIADSTGDYRFAPVVPGAFSAPGLIVYRFGAALFYANAGLFQREISMLAGSAPAPIRWVVVDAGAIINVDYTAARVVRKLQQRLSRYGSTFILANVPTELRPDLDRHGVTPSIGSAQIFDSLQAALKAIGDKAC
jgi:MFS superfamily sulfate permease-like transporter